MTLPHSSLTARIAGIAGIDRNARPRRGTGANLAPASLLLVALATAPAAYGADRLLLSGGEYADAAYYGYAGVVLPGPGRENGRGLMQRYWVDRFGYEYDGAPGRVKADAWGAEAALGWGSSSAKGWWSAWAGARYTETSLSPDDVTATARGSQLGVKFQLEAERRLDDRWRAGAMGSFTTTQNGYWVRGRLMRSATPRLALGAEAVAAGNDESDSVSAGLVLTWQPAASGWSVGVKSGYRQQEGADGAYAGLEIGFGF